MNLTRYNHIHTSVRDYSLSLDGKETTTLERYHCDTLADVEREVSLDGYTMLASLRVLYFSDAIEQHNIIIRYVLDNGLRMWYHQYNDGHATVEYPTGEEL